MKVTRLATAPPGTTGIPAPGGVGSPPELEGPGEDPDGELEELGGTPARDDGVSVESPDMLGLDE